MVVFVALAKGARTMDQFAQRPVLKSLFVESLEQDESLRDHPFVQGLNRKPIVNLVPKGLPTQSVIPLSPSVLDDSFFVDKFGLLF